VLLCLLPLTVVAEEMPVPAKLQVPLILKILTFDRNFEQRVGPALRIGIIYTSQDPASHRAKEEIARTLDYYTTKTIKKLPITYISLEYQTEQAVQEAVKTEHINVLYVVPGNADHLQKLLNISQANRITTVTGVPTYVKEGVAVGIGVEKNQKPRILINLRSSKSEGSAFDANLLRLATVVQ
jgi:hypothetical protein